MARSRSARNGKVKKVTPSPAALEAPLQADIFSIDQLTPRYTRESNPNKMDDERFGLLVASIRTEGFLVPVLVNRMPDGKLVIEDGHHRYWAAKEAGLRQITAIVKAYSAARGALIGVGLNRNRGELDLGQTVEVVQAAREAEELEVQELSVLTGFTSAELEAFFTAAHEVDPIEDEVAPQSGDDDTKLPRPFLLEITFSTKDQLKLARRKLRKAAGKGGDLALGLMNVLGLAEGEDTIDAEDDEDE